MQQFFHAVGFCIRGSLEGREVGSGPAHQDRGERQVQDEIQESVQDSAHHWLGARAPVEVATQSWLLPFTVSKLFFFVRYRLISVIWTNFG